MRRQRRDRTIGTRKLVSAVLLAASICAPVAFAQTQAAQTLGGVPPVPSPWIGAANLRYEWPITHEITGCARIDEIVHSHNPGPFTELDPRASGYDPRF